MNEKDKMMDRNSDDVFPTPTTASKKISRKDKDLFFQFLILANFLEYLEGKIIMENSIM